MEHIEARELVSARLDGELPRERVQELDGHLASCDECRAFADGALRLRAMTAELPREEPGELFARRRVVRRIPLLRLAPALAAVLAITLFLIVGAPPGFKVPVADAARALTTIRTFYAEREITQADSAKPIRERIWFIAPGFLRIEAETPDGDKVFILRPGEQYERSASGQRRTVGLPPDVNVLPEPLSPTIALLGKRTGPGPDIDGRATVRYVLDLGEDRKRTADVDAERYTALGITESLVLNKSATKGGTPTGHKRVLDVQINEPIDAGLFEIPNIAADDAGYRLSAGSRLPIGPRHEPEGFRLAATAVGPDSTRAVYTRGAFALQVDVASRATSGDSFTAKSIPVTLNGHNATIIEDLYKLPSISFQLEGRIITITAPMTPESLVATARTMFL